MNKKERVNKKYNDIWLTRQETYYNHWTRGNPKNQIQLAFRNHWMTFQEIMKDTGFNNGKKVLEVGCGRGSISCYFSDAGYKCSLLDISPKAIDTARNIFLLNKLKAEFTVGDARKLPYKDGSFDIVVSIGLLEHFKNIKKILREQYRVLSKGGLLLLYIVPKYKNNIQNNYRWVNEILKGYKMSQEGSKSVLYRSDSGSRKYISVLKLLGLRKIQAKGIYPLPMISHSIEFPFSLMPDESEKALIKELKAMLTKIKLKKNGNPWLCEEGYGQAFLIWGLK